MRPREASLFAAPMGDAELTDRLLRSVWQKGVIPRWAWFVTGGGTVMLFVAITYTVLTGIGTWGNDIPVAWAFAIINFVWWIGIGHAGTFISAILLLLEQRWRSSINRIAESMTLFALVQAAMFPLLHLGRPWFFYWLIPYPATMKVWPQFMSTLPWDVAAVMTYSLVSLLFWYIGMVPDLASVRDRAPELWRRRIYGVFALGWRGSARHWRHHRIAQLLLAGLATPLVLSVHSIVSMDFAIAKLPGWHSTIFPPYFVAGAIFSGFVMVLTLLIPLRHAFGLGPIITKRHLEMCAKMVLVTGLIVTFSYVCEDFIAWYSGDTYEVHVYFWTRPFGPYAFAFWTMTFCNVVLPQIFWFKKMRQNALVLFIAALLIQVGMWTERFVLIVTSEQQDFLPSSWHVYIPSPTDAAILFGTISFFFFLCLLMAKLVPFVPVAEAKELMHELRRQGVTPGEPGGEGAADA